MLFDRLLSYIRAYTDEEKETTENQSIPKCEDILGLLPCPYCGEKPKTRFMLCGGSYAIGHSIPYVVEIKITCTKCDAFQEIDFECGRDDATIENFLRAIGKSVNKWNTRNSGI